MTILSCTDLGSAYGVSSGDEGREVWRRQAACFSKDKDPELFFPVATRGPAARKQIEAAKAVCRSCPVMAECLVWALQARQEHGVWGGLSQDERRSLQRREQRSRRSAGVAA